MLSLKSRNESKLFKSSKVISYLNFNILIFLINKKPRWIKVILNSDALIILTLEEEIRKVHQNYLAHL